MNNSFLIKNNLNKTIIISDLPSIPQIKPNELIDLLEYTTRKEINNSEDLSSLLEQDFVTLFSDDEKEDEIDTSSLENIFSQKEEIETFSEESEEENDDIGFLLDTKDKIRYNFLPTTLINKIENIEKALQQLNSKGDTKDEILQIVGKGLKPVVDDIKQKMSIQNKKIEQISKQKTIQNNQQPTILNVNFNNINIEDLSNKVSELISHIEKTSGFTLNNINMEFKLK